jgi:hypothetical protein
VWAAAGIGGDVRGCGRRRGARPGLADAAGGVDAAGVMGGRLGESVIDAKKLVNFKVVISYPKNGDKLREVAN